MRSDSTVAESSKHQRFPEAQQGRWAKCERSMLKVPNLQWKLLFLAGFYLPVNSLCTQRIYAAFNAIKPLLNPIKERRTKRKGFLYSNRPVDYSYNGTWIPLFLIFCVPSLLLLCICILIISIVGFIAFSNFRKICREIRLTKRNHYVTQLLSYEVPVPERKLYHRFLTLQQKLASRIRWKTHFF